MGKPKPNRTAMTTAAAEREWLAVSDGLLRGVNHALSNRLGAISAVARVLEPGGSDGGAALFDVLQGEIAQAEQVAGLLPLLARERDGDAEPLRVPDLLDGIVALHGLQGPMRDITCDVEIVGDPLPVWAECSALTHALLLLLSAAARAAQLAGGQALAVRCTGDGQTVTMTIEVHASSGAGEARDPARAEDLLDEVDPTAAAALLQGGGEVEVVREDAGGAGRPVRFELRMPTLAEVRRRERRGAE